MFSIYIYILLHEFNYHSYNTIPLFHHRNKFLAKMQNIYLHFDIYIEIGKEEEIMNSGHGNQFVRFNYAKRSSLMI